MFAHTFAILQFAVKKTKPKNNKVSIQASTWLNDLLEMCSQGILRSDQLLHSPDYALGPCLILERMTNILIKLRECAAAFSGCTYVRSISLVVSHIQCTCRIIINRYSLQEETSIEAISALVGKFNLIKYAKQVILKS